MAKRTKKKPRFNLLKLFRYNYVGLTSSLLFFFASLTPSLLPRPWLHQGIISGIFASVGYGCGVVVSWCWRRYVRKELSARTKKIVWIITMVSIIPFLLFVLHAGWNWQNEVRELVGKPIQQKTSYTRQLLVTAVTVFIVVKIFQLGYACARRLQKKTDRWLPANVAWAISIVITILLGWGIVKGVVFRSYVGLSSRNYGAANRRIQTDLVQPTSPFRSGSTNSLAPWETLGKQGRKFVAGGPTQEQLQTFNAEQPKLSVRAYAGLDSAPDAKSRAKLVVDELNRTDAFSRPVLVVVTATGTGWVNPESVDALEYMYNGNIAIASMQYSFLPSWISFSADKDNAREAGRELFNQIYDQWQTLPQQSRPKLLVFGLSLGAFGGQTAFSGEQDLQNRTDGALFLGSPNSSQLWRDFEHHRLSGTPERNPIYDNGKTVRFADEPSELSENVESWTKPRVVFLQHASDPIVWWSPKLLFDRPDWLGESKGNDVSRHMHWIPVLTFLQVSIDQFFGTTVPDGHGHSYGGEPAEAWSYILPPTYWSEQKTQNLRTILDAY